MQMDGWFPGNPMPGNANLRESTQIKHPKLNQMVSLVSAKQPVLLLYGEDEDTKLQVAMLAVQLRTGNINSVITKRVASGTLTDFQGLVEAENVPFEFAVTNLCTSATLVFRFHRKDPVTGDISEAFINDVNIVEPGKTAVVRFDASQPGRPKEMILAAVKDEAGKNVTLGAAERGAAAFKGANFAIFVAPEAYMHETEYFKTPGWRVTDMMVRCEVIMQMKGIRGSQLGLPRGIFQPSDTNPVHYGQAFSASEIIRNRSSIYESSPFSFGSPGTSGGMKSFSMGPSFGNVSLSSGSAPPPQASLFGMSASSRGIMAGVTAVSSSRRDARGPSLMFDADDNEECLQYSFGGSERRDRGSGLELPAARLAPVIPTQPSDDEDEMMGCGPMDVEDSVAANLTQGREIAVESRTEMELSVHATYEARCVIGLSILPSVKFATSVWPTPKRCVEFIGDYFNGIYSTFKVHDADAKECCVCTTDDPPPDCVILACGHASTCRNCVEEIMKRHMDGPECPICRGTIRGHVTKAALRAAK